MNEWKYLMENPQDKKGHKSDKTTYTSRLQWQRRRGLSLPLL